MTKITSEPLDPARIMNEVSTPESGGVAIFVGVVRNKSQGKMVHHLEYASYVPMGEKLMAEIEREIKQKWGVHRVVLVHRIGLLQIGEVAVVAAVSAEHRKEAFESCQYAIERIKSIVPIWKKESFGTDEAWSVGNTPADRVVR